MAAAVFVLCALTSLVCLALLVRAHRATRARLVFWSAVCFVGLAINNIILAINELAVPSVHMPWRAIPAAIGLLALAFALAVEELRSRRARSRRRVTRRRSGAAV